MKREPTPYLNEYNHDHFVTPRQYDRNWLDEPNWDAVVMGAVVVLAAGTFIFLALTEAL